MHNNTANSEQTNRFGAAEHKRNAFICANIISLELEIMAQSPSQTAHKFEIVVFVWFDNGLAVLSNRQMQCQIVIAHSFFYRAQCTLHSMHWCGGDRNWFVEMKISIRRCETHFFSITSYWKIATHTWWNNYAWFNYAIYGWAHDVCDDCKCTISMRNLVERVDFYFVVFC